MRIKKTIVIKLIFITILFVSATFSQAMITTDQSNQNEIISLKEQIIVEQPIISDTDSKTTITIPSVETYLSSPGKPKIPIIKKTYTFPKNTNIHQIICNPTESQIFHITKPIQKTPAFQSISGNNMLTNQINPTFFSEYYPQNWFTTQTGAGINSNGNHVLYVTITLHPIRYKQSENVLNYVSEFNIEISHSTIESAAKSFKADQNHELVIITPEYYKQTLSSFVTHKQQYNLHPLVKTTDEIYNEFQGRDEQEKIKYFIKHAIEIYNTKYVLLIGDITQLPIRQTDAYPWESYHGSGILTDLYYSDIYDASFQFASWDTNENDIFGEVNYDSFPPNPNNIIDQVDLYPDVHIGRIPCSNTDELTTVLTKIITYEEVTAYQNWFKKILFAGGDTFPLSKGSPLNVFEGEITNVKVGQEVPDFEQIRLWTSKHNLNAITFNREISKGVGFVSYAGHGFEHGWGTYRPNAIIDGNLIFYFTPYLKRLTNEHRLPIVFFDACLTAKLDFNISDLEGYVGIRARLFSFLLGFDNSKQYFPPFAWSMLKHDNGGAIATVGATRPAYTFVDKDGVYAGAGFLDVRFFNAYEEGVTVGEMLSQAQTDYQQYVGKDMFTIEEYILLGDPSLRVGGYL